MPDITTQVDAAAQTTEGGTAYYSDPVKCRGKRAVSFFLESSSGATILQSHRGCQVRRTGGDWVAYDSVGELTLVLVSDNGAASHAAPRLAVYGMNTASGNPSAMTMTIPWDEIRESYTTGIAENVADLLWTAVVDGEGV